MVGMATLDEQEAKLIEKLERADLYDRQADDAADRLALLRYNLEQGVTVDELVEAAQLGRLEYVAGDAYIRPAGRSMTAEEVAARAEVPVDDVLLMWRSAGLVEPAGGAAAMGEADVAVVEVFRDVQAFFGRSLAMQLLRTMAAALANTAEAEVSTFTTTVGAEIVRSGTPVDLARANVAMTQLLPRVAQVLDVLHRHQIEAAILRLFSDPTTRESVTKSLAVGFADLVGFTAWTARSDAHALAALVEEFEVRARDTVSGHGGRVVKMIGDEVMFVTGDAATACEVAAGLVAEAAHLAELPRVRVGLACGDVLTLNGDYYGPVVNLASRLVAAAEPGAVLVDKAVRRSARHEFRPASLRQLKGFDAPVETYRLATPTRAG